MLMKPDLVFKVGSKVLECTKTETIGLKFWKNQAHRTHTLTTSKEIHSTEVPKLGHLSSLPINPLTKLVN